MKRVVAQLFGLAHDLNLTTFLKSKSAPHLLGLPTLDHRVNIVAGGLMTHLDNSFLDGLSSLFDIFLDGETVKGLELNLDKGLGPHLP